MLPANQLTPANQRAHAKLNNQQPQNAKTDLNKCTLRGVACIGLLAGVFGFRPTSGFNLRTKRLNRSPGLTLRLAQMRPYSNIKRLASDQKPKRLPARRLTTLSDFAGPALTREP